MSIFSKAARKVSKFTNFVKTNPIANVATSLIPGASAVLAVGGMASKAATFASGAIGSKGSGSSAVPSRSIVAPVSSRAGVANVADGVSSHSFMDKIKEFFSKAVSYMKSNPVVAVAVVSVFAFVAYMVYKRFFGSKPRTVRRRGSAVGAAKARAARARKRR